MLRTSAFFYRGTGGRVDTELISVKNRELFLKLSIHLPRTRHILKMGGDGLLRQVIIVSDGDIGNYVCRTSTFKHVISFRRFHSSL